MTASKKKKIKKAAVKDKSPVAPPHKAEEEDEKAGFDFGGLPARDLKRNLGCG